MIYGERIILRAVERKDLPRYVQWLHDPAMREHFGCVAPLSLAQAEARYEKMLEDPTVRAFAIEFEGQHVGGAVFKNLDSRNASAEVGLFIGPPELWDRGLEQDVLHTLVRFGFEQMNLHRIYLRALADDERAIHLYEQAGFRHEGRWRQAELCRGRHHDLLWMSILRDDV